MSFDVEKNFFQLRIHTENYKNIIYLQKLFKRCAIALQKWRLDKKETEPYLLSERWPTQL